MMTPTHCQLLGSVLNHELNDDECLVLGNLGSIRALKDEETLIEEGKVDNQLHVLIDGHLAVTRRVAEGEWVTLHVLKPGELAGELGFIDGQPHSATLRAMGPTHVFSLDREKFETLVNTHPGLMYRIMRAIVRGVHVTLRRMNAQQIELTNYITKEHGRY
ncbi:MAG TPA: cyclic nucleotide-binding domain-containing protein [Thiobacillaceae bacterium]|nr:cyclic nucleotide-binding domain-containing protein [Thiobacillaceae bacterium]